ncbi:MAG: hypothetical protein JWP65_96 [Ramlibacter sp.]|jgi:hypothetical protein|uniref:LolA-related protein n=1 Tax=Ramlibacter sp. TaxID=1917967 RepID=UPI00262A2481|nr:LolA-related protein [Ramlibacter sp.]MDB5749675.1 hypothetical protein [Ramlibacter sp.]
MKPAVRGLLALLLIAGTSLAQALELPQLQQLLRSGARPDARYEEVRESPWLSSPVTTRGTLHVTRQGLEKRIESPGPETWRLLQDRLEWQGADGARRQIPFTQAPALQALADVTRRAVAGDLAGLERDFRITVRGHADVWSARLEPRSAALQRQLDSVELQGTGGQLRVLIVTERQGERTTTRILP